MEYSFGRALGATKNKAVRDDRHESNGDPERRERDAEHVHVVVSTLSRGGLAERLATVGRSAEVGVASAGGPAWAVTHTAGRRVVMTGVCTCHASGTSRHIVTRDVHTHPIDVKTRKPGSSLARSAMVNVS
eukprot:1003642-Prymnesium_polylepis.1